MKKLSDYKDEAAVELWADLLEPMTNILGDPKMQKLLKSKKAPLLKAKGILESHKKDAVDVMLRIDDTPIDGLNILMRLAGLILEFTNNPDMKDFFVSAGQDLTANKPSGDATENTEEA